MSIQEAVISKEEAKRQRKNARWKERYSSDPAFREKARESTNNATKKWRTLNPEKNKLQRKRRYKLDPQKAAEYCKKWQEVPENRMSVLVRGAIHRSKKTGIQYDVNSLYVLVECPATHCSLCLTTLDYSYGDGHKPNGPSIDRVIPDKGYVAKNLAILCNTCNRMKGDATAEQHRRIADFIDGWKEKNE